MIHSPFQRIVNLIMSKIFRAHNCPQDQRSPKRLIIRHREGKNQRNWRWPVVTVVSFYFVNLRNENTSTYVAANYIFRTGNIFCVFSTTNRVPFKNRLEGSNTSPTSTSTHFTISIIHCWTMKYLNPLLSMVHLHKQQQKYSIKSQSSTKCDYLSLPISIFIFTKVTHTPLSLKYI
jgi:hypothetical protein